MGSRNPFISHSSLRRVHLKGFRNPMPVKVAKRKHFQTENGFSQSEQQMEKQRIPPIIQIQPYNEAKKVDLESRKKANILKCQHQGKKKLLKKKSVPHGQIRKGTCFFLRSLVPVSSFIFELKPIKGCVWAYDFLKDFIFYLIAGKRVVKKIDYDQQVTSDLSCAVTLNWVFKAVTLMSSIPLATLSPM